MRVGIGYDVHKLVEGRDLYIGGVKIPYEKGLLGHSDADVLLHAIKDALLGAAALGDIGRHFPDTDDKYKGVSSLFLLKQVNDKLKNKGYKCNNVDCIIVAQKPKMAPYIHQMRENIAKALEIDIDDVNVKATTTEKLGFEGREEGISAHAIVSIDKI
ncbi:2-C-methyl-D-erythritol 2,4-cyclodiphosphate synthase [Alkalithermobacter thermoalcaliphilus JW-YL-7 = DSM 7308]|uniref:2-C-methyl-D-erythritol 2,4-cyclodiphosphate synthase n=1 Tax=Alkalithermobacter thermoalcaliphilus JW-YL-7 = DSM 7308 TaxID=1121328 RepID=A0A150FMS5_CLOPD|nr:2-C-methyl-D-erythritol 2,4-cyclodiphosphate synthase [[Clostridium] paradoxum JW-YL-7 = DSM 7308]SHL27192.1 2-C-methyl-D-erythritol 2,4-cyclodiphosphate synthase [[Clostridium] paradoxum JW-YL-7 = DSM 7308]